MSRSILMKMSVSLPLAFLLAVSSCSSIEPPEDPVESHAVQLCVKTVDGRPIFYQIIRESYAFNPGDTLSDVLAHRGLAGQKNFELYSKGKWLQHAMDLNPNIKFWDKVMPGQLVTLEYPKVLAVLVKELQSERAACIPVARHPEALKYSKKERRRHRYIVEHAGTSTIEDIAALPKESIDQIPVEVIVEKLTEEKLYELPTGTIAKIPEPVVKKKAQDASFFDAMQPGMSKLFESVSDQTAGGYVGMRYGTSLAKAEGAALASKLRMFGLLADLRGGALNGVRLYWDYIPESSVAEDGNTLSLGWRRVSLAYSFEIPVRSIVDYVHVIPKVGQYVLNATLPSETSEDGGVETHRFTIGKGLAAGLEVDAELASIFYVVRGWAARDFSGIGIKGKEKVASTRAGLDFFLKGGGFSIGNVHFSPTYLAFVFYESLELSGSDPEVGDYVVGVDVSFAGLGLGLQW